MGVPGMNVPLSGSAVQAVLDLVGQQLSCGGEARLRTHGNSMLPMLHPGDVLVVQAASPDDLRCGDLVVVRRSDDLVTHRLVAVTPQGWVLKGDAWGAPDPPVAGGNILGRVVGVERESARLDLRLDPWVRRGRWLGRLGAWEFKWYGFLGQIWLQPPLLRRCVQRAGRMLFAGLQRLVLKR